MGRLDGKVAAVTGGASGIGEATVRRFVEEGARVAFADRDGPRGACIVEQIEAAGGDALFVEARMDREAEAADFIRRAAEHFGQLDILVNNAAIRLYHRVTEASEESWDTIWAVNVKGYAFCAKAAIPFLRQSAKGSIVNIASNSAVIASRNAVQYDTTKAAVTGLTRAMARDHAEEGIRVNALCPGPTFTPFHQQRAAAAGKTPRVFKEEFGTLHHAQAGGHARGDCRLCPVPGFRRRLLRHRHLPLRRRWRDLHGQQPRNGVPGSGPSRRGLSHRQMTTLRSDIEKALDELISNEEGMRFQGLAVVLAKQKWPEFIACERKNDLGLDAYASANLASDGKGKGLVCSITPTYDKLATDATRVRKHFKDVTILIFATPCKVLNPKKRQWEAKVRQKFGYELEVISREDVIASLMLPDNAGLCRSCLRVDVQVEESVQELIARIRQAARDVTESWTTRTKGRPLIELCSMRLDQQGDKSAKAFSLDEIDAALQEGRRVLLEAPAGRGKTTTLIQLALHHLPTTGTTFLIDLPAWISSRRGILEFIAGAPSFEALSIDASALAKASKAEHFSFLLNGWNEIVESNSIHAMQTLLCLEREFPQAGIIVATRTHNIVPPLPGAIKLRLLPLTRQQRSAYLKVRLGVRADELRLVLDSHPVLEELTQTPFILSEVAEIFEAGEQLPTTKIGVLESVIMLLERSEEHRNHLHLPPLSARATSYLDELAIKMTGQGVVMISEEDARHVCAAVGKRLRDSGQIASIPEPAAVLATLCGHHVLERVEHPATAFPI